MRIATRRTRPDLENLEARELLAADITATLSKGVLAVVSNSAASPIEVDILATRTRRGPQGQIQVDGVGTFQASQVKKIVIACFIGEPLVVNRSKSWNPPVQVIARKPPVVTPPVITPPDNTPTFTESQAEQAIVDAVNQFRAANGLPALRLSSKLIQAAKIQAGNMALLNTMAHELPAANLPTLLDRANYVRYNYWTLGENIAYGYPDTSSVMNGWINSPGHRANMLGADYTEIGVGIAYSTNGTPYYCQVFGKPMA